MIFLQVLVHVGTVFLSSLLIRCDSPVLSLFLRYFLNFVNFNLLVSWRQACLNPLVIFWSQNWIRVVLTFTITLMKVMILGGVFKLFN